MDPQQTTTSALAADTSFRPQLGDPPQLGLLWFHFIDNDLQLHRAVLEHRYIVLAHCLFLGLSKPTFGYLESVGFSPLLTDGIRIGLLTLGAVFGLYVGYRILMLQTGIRWRVWTALLPQVAGILVVLFAWAPVFDWW